MTSELAVGEHGAGSTQPLAARDRRSGSAFVAILVGVSLWIATAASMTLLERSSTAESGIILMIWVNITLILGALTMEIARRPFSLNAMHLVALFLFLGAPSLFQYTVGEYAVAGPVTMYSRDTPIALLAVLFWLVGYVATYELHGRFARAVPMAPLGRFLSREISSSRAVVILVCAVFVLVYLGVVVGLAGVSTRAGAREASTGFTLGQEVARGTGLAFYLINHLLLRAYPLVAFVTGALALRSAKPSARPMLIGLLVVVAIGILIADNPFASQRIWLVTCMFAVVAPWVLARMRTGWAIVVMSVAGLTVLPALSHIRDTESFQASLDVLRWSGLTSPLDYLAFSTDTDSLGMLVLCVHWTTVHGYQWGLQMASGLLTWFPRALWPGKGIGTGGMVTEDLGFEFTNLASPIVAEPFVDFGLIGVIPIACLIGWLFSVLDRTYWSQPREKPSPTRVIDVILPFWLGLVVLLVRGDLMASIVFILAFTFWVIPLGLGAKDSARRPSESFSSGPRTASAQDL